jgi:uncharacterized phage protein (TIGR01671 family)
MEMREIKFRAIDRDSSKYLYSTDYGVGSFFIGYEDGQYKTEPEQFTGLQDKNGKDIYEGDVIRDGEYIGPVVIGHCKDMNINREYAVYYNGVYADIPGETDVSCRCNFRNWEVIGNIHETEET